MCVIFNRPLLALKTETYSIGAVVHTVGLFSLFLYQHGRFQDEKGNEHALVVLKLIKQILLIIN